MRHGSSCGCSDCQEFRRSDRVGAVKSTEKPILKIGAYHHAAASDYALADHSLRLMRNRDGRYYWALAREGEHHWWLTVVTVLIK
jgi:hypothetical protein